MLLILPSLCSSLYALGLAIFILSRNLRHHQAQVFALGLLSLFWVEVGNLLTLYSTLPQEVIFWKRRFLPAEALLPGNLLLFSLVFARSNYKGSLKRGKPLLISVYLMSLIFLIFAPSDYIYYLPASSSRLLTNPGKIYLGEVGYLFYLFLLLSSVIILANLENTLRSSAAQKREQIKFVILGVAGILAFSIYTNSQAVLYSQLKLDYLPLHSLIVLICLGMMTLSVVKNKLFPAEIFVSREIVYHTLTFLLAGGYLLGVALFAYGIHYFGERLSLYLTILFVFLAVLGLITLLLSARLQRRVKVFIGKHLYKSKYDYRSLWQEFTGRLGARLSPEEVLSPITELLAETLGTNKVGLWLYDRSRKEFSLVQANGFRVRGGSSIKEDDDLIQYILKVNRPVTIKELQKAKSIRPIGEKTQARWEEIGGAVYVPLIANDRTVGLINLGEEVNGKGFDEEDCAILKTMATPIANHLLTAQLSNELILAKERETFSNLTLFVLHDLKNFISNLSLIAYNATQNWDDPEFKTDALNSISSIIAKMKTLINKLSTAPNDDLQRQPIDLNALISETIMRFNGTGEIKFLPGKLSPPVVEIDYEKIQKVVHNLILNAYEAISDKGEITITTEARDGWAIFTVADNGCGISEEFITHSLFVPFRTTKKHGLGIGLYQCKQIVAAHQGKIEVESKIGQGTTFRIKLPIKSDGRESEFI